LVIVWIVPQETLLQRRMTMTPKTKETPSMHHTLVSGPAICRAIQLPPQTLNTWVHKVCAEGEHPLAKKGRGKA
jgi:hypothetical protein